MINVFIIMSHNLTDEQICELKEKFNADNIIYLEKDDLDKWANVPPDVDISEGYMDSIKSFVIKHITDKNYAVIEGEYGVTYSLVNWCFDNGIVPLYSTTKRIYKNSKKDDGSIINIHMFKHVCFRKYKKDV